jgi:hypothetical protein
MNRELSEKIDTYLFGEMKSPDNDIFEERLMSDDALFFAVKERENELVDRFVSGLLNDSEAARFRSSLLQFPSRKAKVSNAQLLKQHISETRAAETVATGAKAPWYRRLGFAFQAPAFAAAALSLLLVGTIGVLFVQNRKLNQQVASLNSNGNDLSTLKQREAELQAQLEAERTAGGDLTTDLEAERERRTALENELSELRKQIATSRPPANNALIVPTIATLILRPMGGRGGPDPVRKLRIENDEKRVALKIFLPGDTPEGTFSVRVNDIAAGSNIRPNREAGGASSVTVAAAAASFRNGMNRVDVVDANAKTVASFAVLLERSAPLK